MQDDNKKSKVKKGWLAVEVGLEEEEDYCGFQRFVIPISYLYHPLFKTLLDRAREVYGYHADGPLRLPCSVDEFLHLRWRIEKESVLVKPRVVVPKPNHKRHLRLLLFSHSRVRVLCVFKNIR
ncbi:hypothetical protein HS088_TW07G00643 [Tripterygium wilfordii]|uniref:Auxin-induced protein 6B n=1 Tax=Tripterygium wilfordii TaxID=458696 RepID=A0A7J7DFG0_TRIWF|nr:hypothetical protein HS088_TW07G00643 [Tripterygium wilfordii]